MGDFLSGDDFQVNTEPPATPQPALMSLADALAILRAQPERVTEEIVLTGDAAGRVCTQAIRSPVALPPHTAAAYDGFAIRAEDIAGASLEAAVLLPVSGNARCGDGPFCGMPQSAWEVAAGAPLPSPFDTVLRAASVAIVARREDGAPSWIRVTRPMSAGTDVRHRGEDLAEGALIADTGTVLRPVHLMVLATAGIERVAVRAQPRVAVLSTGRELVDDWREELAPGQVRNSNGPYLVAMLQRHGALPRYLRTVLDDRDEFQHSLAWASTHRFPLVISSGATAASRDDFVGDVLGGLGAQVLFRGVAIKPGWPVILARLPHGGFFLGLPGNPASCAACFRLFALPLLRMLSGLLPEASLSVHIDADCERDPDKTQLLKARVTGVDGRLVATALPGQEPYRIAPLLEANAWVIVPPGSGICAAGTLVETLMMLDDWILPGLTRKEAAPQ